MPGILEFSILGPLEGRSGGRRIALGGPRQRIVIAMLLLAVGRIVSVDDLIEAVWNDRQPATGRTQIAICVAALRRIFKDVDHPDVIVTAHPGYMLAIPDHHIDANRFKKQVMQARQAARQGRKAEAADISSEALALWHGPALAAISSRLVETEALYLNEQRLEAYEELTGLRLQLGQHRALIGELTIAVREHPLREQTRVHLMLAQYRAGHRADSLQTFRDGRRQLVDELGMEPGPVLQTLCEAILRDDPVLSAGAAERAEPAEMSVVPSQLPPSARFFTGRAAELAELDRLLPGRSESYPVHVGFINGPPGIGKTSLVVEWARRVIVNYPDGQLFVDLGGYDEKMGLVAPEVVLDRFLRALVPSARIPANFQERVALYRSTLSERRILIVLDSARTFAQVEPLLPGQGGSCVLITSRNPLEALVGGYASVQLSLSRLTEPEAQALLSQVIGDDRVATESPSLARLSDLCDRLPLALRIAGARLAAKPYLTIGSLASRMDDEQQRLNELSRGEPGLRSSFELGYRYLDLDAARLFRRLSLLDVPDFAAWVGSALLDTGQYEAENLIEQLVDAQFLEVNGPDLTGNIRYVFQNLVKLYARERAMEEESDEEQRAACDRAFGCWLALAEEAHRREYGGDFTVLHGNAVRWLLEPGYIDQLMSVPLEWLEVERPCIIAVISRAGELRMDELAWDLAMTANTLFEARNYLDDWRMSSESALRAAQNCGNLRGEAAMLYSLGTLETFLQNYDQGSSLFGSALSIFEDQGLLYGRALTLRNIALLDRMRGDLVVARERCREVRMAFQVLGDRFAEAHVLGNLAQIELELGRADIGVQYAQEAVEICHDIGTARGEAQSLYRLAEAFFEQERFNEAAKTYQRVLLIVRSNGDKLGEAYATRGLGETLLRAGDLDQAEKVLLQARDLSRQIPDRFVDARACLALGWMHMRMRKSDWALHDFQRAGEIFAKLHAPFWQEKVSHAVSILNEPEAGFAVPLK